MKLNNTIKKLQKAILQKRLVIKINSHQFYSQEQSRMITMYVLSTPVIHIDNRGKCKERDFEILKSASQVDIVNCLVDIYRTVKEWS